MYKIQSVVAAFRSLRRYPVHVTVLTALLAVSFAASIAVTHHVRNEVSYDKFWSDGADIYRAQTIYSYPGSQPWNVAQSPFPLLDFLKQQVAEVETAARLFNPIYIPHLRYKDTRLQIPISYVDPGFFDIFDVEMVSGQRSSIFEAKTSLILSETAAMKLFGDDNPIGKVVNTRFHGGARDFQVTGVFKDLPKNTHIEISAFALLDENYNRWTAPLVYTYIKLKKGTDPVSVEKKIPELERAHIPPDGAWNIAEILEVKLHRLERLHLFQNGEKDYKPSGGIDTVYLYVLAGLMLLAVVGTNFVNMMVVRANFRMKEVSLRKVFGANRTDILALLLPETLVISLGAYFLALVILEVWGGDLFQMVGYAGETSGSAFVFSCGLVGAVALLLALFAGLYPTAKLTLSRPIDSLHSRDASFGVSMRFSRVLMGLQFVIAIAVAIVGSVVWAQMSYIKHKELGFDASNVLVVPKVPANASQRSELLQRFAAVAGVVDSTSSFNVPGYGNRPAAGFSTVNDSDPGKYVLPVQFIDYNFFEFFRTPILSGRSLSPDYSGDIYSELEGSTLNIILNETAVKRVGFGNADSAIGKQLWWGAKDKPQYLTVVGVVADMQHSSLKKDTEPTAYFYKNSSFYTISLRLAADAPADSLEQLENIWLNVVPDQVFLGEFLDQSLRTQYASEYRLLDFLSVVAVFCIFTSCLGIYAISSFILGKQQKEFAIRKILGASFVALMRLATWRALKPAVVAVLVGCPAAYWYLSGWLDSFAHRIEMPWGLYVLGSVGVILMAFLSICTIGYRISRNYAAAILREE